MANNLLDKAREAKVDLTDHRIKFVMKLEIE